MSFGTRNGWIIHRTPWCYLVCVWAVARDFMTVHQFPHWGRYKWRQLVGDISMIIFLCEFSCVSNLTPHENYGHNPWSGPIATYNVWPFYLHGFTLIPAWKSNHRPSEVWAELTYQFPNFIRSTVEVGKWISNFSPHFTCIMDVITAPYWD